MEENIIYIGRGKPAINYVLAIQTQIKKNILNKYGFISLKARGSNINKAVDVSQVAINKFIDNIKVGEIHIGTDHLETQDKKTRSVSNIDIKLVKK